MRYLRFKWLALTAAAMLGTSGMIGYACFMRAPQPVQVWMDDIEVDITNQVAVKRYRCVFKNPNPRAVVGGICYMEVEPGAQVDHMSLVVGGKTVKGEILDVAKANKVFTDLVRQGGSPALLEYYGNKLIRTRVPRIAPNGTVTVNLQYTTVLKSKDDLVRIRVLNTNPKAKLQALKKASVTVRIKSDAAVRNVYSPTHPIKVVENTDKGWEGGLKVTWSQANYLPKTPFVMYYATSKKRKIGVNVLAHREADERGYFMAMISPTVAGPGETAVKDTDIQPKDVVFCVDTSYSMNENGKIDQAKSGLSYCISKLRPGDRFNIVDFSTEARTFSESGLVKLSPRSKQRAQNYVDDMEATGGTAIHEALELSLKQFSADKRLKMIVFMTDGLPTIGERNPDTILKQITSQNKKDVRLFVFGEGYDVNTKLLDVLAMDNKGDSDYIMPKENIGQRISSFFDKVGSPIMTDLRVTIDGVKQGDVYPRQPRDLFKGDQVIVYGRFDTAGERKVTLSGMVGGERRELTYTVNFPAAEDGNDFVPRLWAGQKVSHLLSVLRKNGKNAEMIKEVVGLSKRFGVVTPYTAFLVNDDGLRAAGRGRGFGGGKLAKQAEERLEKKLDQAGARPSAPGADANKDATREAGDFAETRRSLRAGLSEGLAGDRTTDAQQARMRVMRYISGHTYFRAGNFWYDSRYDASKDKAVDVAIGSDAYFALIAKHRGLTKPLALGTVVVKAGKGWVRITPRPAK